MTWVKYFNGYLSGSIESGYYKECWKNSEAAKSITPTSGSVLVFSEKKCYNKDGSEKTCSHLRVKGW